MLGDCAEGDLSPFPRKLWAQMKWIMPIEIALHFFSYTLISMVSRFYLSAWIDTWGLSPYTVGKRGSFYEKPAVNLVAFRDTR
jgi:hypothetical protein